jgi:hypothetical protein
LSGRDELGRRVGIRGRDQLDVETLFLEQAALLGDHKRGMVGIYEPVEQDADLVLSGRG